MLTALGFFALSSCGEDAADESQIDAGTGSDAGVTPDAATDSAPDAATDTAPDAATDTAPDAATDTAPDAAPDATPMPLSTWAVTGVVGRAHAVAVDPSGVYVAGRGGPEGWRVEKRSHVDGAILWEKEATVPGTADAEGIAVDATGVYITGNDRLEKRGLEDGALLWSVDGLPTATSIAADETGVYVVGAEPIPDPGSRAQAWRVDKRSPSDGSEIWSETVDYAVAVDMSDQGRERATAVALDASGLYIGGQVDDNWQLERRDLATGDLLWEQSQAGAPVYVGGLAVSGGGLFVGGSEGHEPPGGRFRWRAERRAASDGAVAWTRSFDPSPDSVGYDDHCMDVAADASAVYLVGLSTPNAFEPSNRRWEIRAWDPATGHDGGWQVAFDFGTGNDVPHQVAVDNRAVYVVGDGDGLWRIQKRDKRDGQLAGGS